MDKNILTNRFCGVFVCAIMLFVAQAFALDCKTGTGWGDFLTQEASKGSDGYYQIDTPEKLAWLSCKVTNKALSSEKFKLTKSIDMQGKLFIPIGSGTGSSTAFKGIFDGQGFTISNLYINGSEINNNDKSSVTGKSKNGNTAYAQNIGLIGILSGGTIRNVVIKDALIYAASSAGTTGINSDKPISVGTFVGWTDVASTIENCVASGSIETSGATNRVGGIVGNVKNVTIKNCVSSVSVTASGASTNVGGIVGALRNGGTVNISSCVYSGNSLYTVDGSVGAIAGSYENVSKINTENLYYSANYDGIGVLPDGKEFNTEKAADLNSDSVVCALNGGQWNKEKATCEGDTSLVWSVGLSDVSLNGSDGFKIMFNANGGTFAPGAKYSKIIAKGAPITADEIAEPTCEGKKFAGWAITADADTASDLGVAQTATTIYAVWYDFYEITFKTGSETAFADATFPDGSKTKTISVAKHGIISVEGFSVPDVYEIGTEANKPKYYFTGWAYESKSFGKDDKIGSKDTLHLSAIDVTGPITLYAVWTKAPTYSVTFDASLHGKTDIHFVRMITEGEKVSRPDTVITDEGYKVVGWCVDENCTEQNEYSFADSLKGNLVLHARWEIESYSIDYELDGGTNSAKNPSTYNINSDEIVFAAPTKDGAKFEGWFYDAALTNPATMIASGSTGNKKLYAKWTLATYAIQYLSGNAISATVNGGTKKHDKAYTLRGAPEQFEVAGCSLDGWSKVDYGQEGYGVDYEFGAEYTDNADLKLFPHWTCETYRIAYEVYDVPATNRNATTYTGPVKDTLVNAFLADKSIVMDNWYWDESFKNPVRYLQNIDKDTTIYAGWYNRITFMPGTKLTNSGSGAAKVEKQKYLNKTYTLNRPNDKYTIANYTLDGWSLTDGGEKVYDLGYDYTDNVHITLYPHWVEIPVVTHYGAVTIEKYSDKTIAKIDGVSEETVNIPTADNVVVDQIIFNRDFSGGFKSTIMFPFTVSLDEVSGGEFCEFKAMEYSSETKKWTFRIMEPEDNELKANKPYIFIADPDSKNISFNLSQPVSFSTEEMNPSVNNRWIFKGSYEKVVLNESHPDWTYGYGYSAEDKNGLTKGKFFRFKTSKFTEATLLPMRAYLVYDMSSALAKSRDAYNYAPEILPDLVDVEIVSQKGIVIGGGELNTKTGELKMDRWYDLSGHQLNAKPTAKGIYYYNGKRVIVR